MAFYIVLVPQGIVGMGALGLVDDEVHDPDRLDAEAYAVSPYLGIGVDGLVILGTAYLGPLEEGVVGLIVAHLVAALMRASAMAAYSGDSSMPIKLKP